jgi:hypothetical protein
MNEPRIRPLPEPGFSRLAEIRRKTLLSLLGISAGIFILAGLLLGAVVIFTNPWSDPDPVIQAHPGLKTYSPREIVHRVRLQRLQQASRRPQITPRMVAPRMNEQALPDLPMDPQNVSKPFQTDYNPPGQFGQGVGIGHGPSGFDRGPVSEVEIPGLPKFRTERLAILVDVSESVVEPGMGGIRGFARVKERVNNVIDSLSHETMFNVIVFADAASQWQGELAVATDVHKNAAKLWLQPFNASEDHKGLVTGNVAPSNLGLQAEGGTTRLDLALTAAFQNRADTILILGDGAPRVRKVLSGDELAAWNRMLDDWRRENPDAEGGAAETGGGGAAPERTRRERVWVPEISRDSGREIGGRWEWRETPAGGGGGGSRAAGKPRPVMPADFQWWTLADFIEHFKILQTELYTRQGLRPPVVHCIGYRVDDEGRDFLKGFTRQYKGEYRTVKK